VGKTSSPFGKSSIGGKLLLGRILTRSGDQAWDFAVPIAILKLIPGELKYAALYYFLIKLGNVLLLPQVTSAIDRVNRFTAAKIGILIQLIGVIIGVASMMAILQVGFHNLNWTSIQGATLLVFLILGGIMSSLGANFMDISIANDLAPSGMSKEELPAFNSKIRQIDLATELGSPILAGLILTLELPEFKLFGFVFLSLGFFK
jgi:iron-regulated transporter 1